MASGTGIGEFFISIGVDAASGAMTVGNLVSRFGELEIATIAEIGVLYELGVQLAAVVDAGMKASLGFEQFTMHTGLSAQALQKWQIVAQQSHASAGDVTSSVEALTKALANINVGIPDSALQGLQWLGINPKDGDRMKSALEVMDEIRHRIGMVTQDPAQQERILGLLHINDNLRETLTLTDAVYSRRASLVPVMSAEQEKQLDELRQTFVEIALKAKYVGTVIAANVSPELETMAKWTTRIVEDIGKIVGWLLRTGPVKDLITIGGASLNTVGDLMDAAAGKGLDVNDIFKQSRRMGGAYTDLHRDFGPLFPEIGEAAFASGGGSKTVSIHKAGDTYHIHEANDPSKTKAAIAEHWEKAMDDFDAQVGARARH